MDLTDKCFICEQQLSSSDSVIVKERGIKSFIASSIQRKDNKEKSFT